MKVSQLRQLIREEIKNTLKEGDSFVDDMEKQIQAERLAQQRKFIAWAKAAAAEKNIERLSFQGNTMVTISLSKLIDKNILTKKLLDKWEAAAKGSAENNLYQGFVVLLTQYKI